MKRLKKEEREREREREKKQTEDTGAAADLITTEVNTLSGYSIVQDFYLGIDLSVSFRLPLRMLGYT